MLLIRVDFRQRITLPGKFFGSQDSLDSREMGFGSRPEDRTNLKHNGIRGNSRDS